MSIELSNSKLNTGVVHTQYVNVYANNPYGYSSLEIAVDCRAPDSTGTIKVTTVNGHSIIEVVG